MSKRRGKRVVVGYVVSLSGKRGGPYGSSVHTSGKVEPSIKDVRVWHDHHSTASSIAQWWRQRSGEAYPHARALPLVRYELDAEEERLRDAVVASADSWESTRSEAWRDDLAINVRALRAHREKVGR